MMKKLIFAANWKLHKTPAQVELFFKQLQSLLHTESSNFNLKDAQQIFFPQPALWTSVAEQISTLNKDHQVVWGAQNCFYELKGAFTGESSLECLKEMGGEWVLVGHSERRAIFGESNEILAQKFLKALEVGLSPMLCVGETLAERESGKTHAVLAEQIRSVLSKLTSSPKVSWAIAYEPVWAIGTGKVATLDLISEAHQMIQSLVEEFKLNAVPILYGGSVKPENAKEILGLSEVQGVLVGGASLEADSWMKLLSATKSM